MNFSAPWFYLRKHLRLDVFRNADKLRFLKFAAVGASGMGVDLMCFDLLIPSMGLAVARAVAIFLAMTWNYELNRRITFSEPVGLNLFVGYLRFCTACLLGAGLSWSISIICSTMSETLSTRPIWAAIIGTGAAAVANFTLCRLWVFSQRQTASELPVHVDESLSRVIVE